jgi:hypothetical protein
MEATSRISSDSKQHLAPNNDFPTTEEKLSKARKTGEDDEPNISTDITAVEKLQNLGNTIGDRMRSVFGQDDRKSDGEQENLTGSDSGHAAVVDMSSSSETPGDGKVETDSPIPGTSADGELTSADPQSPPKIQIKEESFVFANRPSYLPMRWGQKPKEISDQMPADSTISSHNEVSSHAGVPSHAGVSSQAEAESIPGTLMNGKLDIFHPVLESLKKPSSIIAFKPSYFTTTGKNCTKEIVLTALVSVSCTTLLMQGLLAIYNKYATDLMPEF